MASNYNFPTTLLRIIESKQHTHAIGWGPDGTIWIDATTFQDDVINVHFSGIKKLASFTRKLNRYGFKKVIEKNGQNSTNNVRYFHETFCQGITHEAASKICIRRLRSASGSHDCNKLGQAVVGAPPGSDKVYDGCPPNPSSHETETSILQRLLFEKYVRSASMELACNAIVSKLHPWNTQTCKYSNTPSCLRVATELNRITKDTERIQLLMSHEDRPSNMRTPSRNRFAELGQPSFLTSPLGFPPQRQSRYPVGIMPPKFVGRTIMELNQLRLQQDNRAMGRGVV